MDGVYALRELVHEALNPPPVVIASFVMLLYYCFTTALLLLYYCFTNALLLIYCYFTTSFTTSLLLRYYTGDRLVCDERGLYVFTQAKGVDKRRARAVRSLLALLAQKYNY
jgi:hypothetical protein